MEKVGAAVEFDRRNQTKPLLGIETKVYQQSSPTRGAAIKLNPY